MLCGEINKLKLNWNVLYWSRSVCTRHMHIVLCGTQWCVRCLLWRLRAALMVNEPFYLKLSFIRSKYVTRFDSATLAQLNIFTEHFNWRTRHAQFKWAKSVRPESCRGCINKYWRWNTNGKSVGQRIIYECKTMQTSEAYSRLKFLWCCKISFSNLSLRMHTGL